ncbi:uncharacterized [Tachysurus ichikawai]
MLAFDCADTTNLPCLLTIKCKRDKIYYSQSGNLSFDFRRGIRWAFGLFSITLAETVDGVGVILITDMKGSKLGTVEKVAFLLRCKPEGMQMGCHDCHRVVGLRDAALVCCDI